MVLKSVSRGQEKSCWLHMEELFQLQRHQTTFTQHLLSLFVPKATCKFKELM